MPEALQNQENLTTRCCIVGGGPAGMMLGFLLARSGVEVIVLEKHKDFLRDFRGDTIHPSTLELLVELGLLAEFLKIPHQELRAVHATIEGKQFLLPTLRTSQRNASSLLSCPNETS